MIIDPSRPRHSVQALSHSVSRHAWRRGFEVRSADATLAISLRVGLAAAVVLVGFGVTGHVALAGFAMLGALCTAFSRHESARRTAATVGFVGVLVAVSVLIGAVIALVVETAAVQIGLVAAFAGIVAMVLAALRIGGPGPVVLVFAVSAAVGSTGDGSDLCAAVVATAIGAGVGFAIALLPFVPRVWTPTRLAVTPWRRGGHNGLRKVNRHSAFTATTGECPGPRPAGFVAVGIAGLRTRRVRQHGARIVIAAALAGWLASTAGLDHPLWASMGALAAMQGIDYGVTVQRAIQRLLGNVGGALIAGAVIVASLDYWPTVGVIVLLQVLAEVAATRSYALCSLAVTPMALLVVGLGAPVGPEIGLNRVLDTLIGVVVGVVVAAVTVSTTDRGHLPTHTDPAPSARPGIAPRDTCGDDNTRCARPAYPEAKRRRQWPRRCTPAIWSTSRTRREPGWSRTSDPGSRC